MLKAFALGGTAQISLLVAGVAACWIKVSRTVIGALAGFGAGAMLAAIAFDLVPEARVLSQWEFSLWALGGVAVFLLGDRIVERRFGESGEGGAPGIVVGSVVDGV